MDPPNKCVISSVQEGLRLYLLIQHSAEEHEEKRYKGREDVAISVRVGEDAC